MNKLLLAHEQYVLTKDQFQQGLSGNDTNVLSALNSTENLKTAIIAGLGINTLIFLYIIFALSPLGETLDKKLQTLENLGSVILRLTFGISLIASALFASFLGPENQISLFPFSYLISIALIIIGILAIAGILKQVSTILFVALFIFASFIFGVNLLNYAEFLGVALIILVSKSTTFPKISNDIQALIIRITYGIAIIYPAIYVKLMHPQIVADIENKYHLSQFSFLFPKDPLLLALGTGMTEIIVGLFIIIGFTTRFTALITLVLYLGSMLFFKEAVWPHILPAGIAVYLLINNGGRITIDQVLQKVYKKFRKR